MENNPFKTLNDKLDKLQYSFDELQTNSDSAILEPDLLNVKQASTFLKQSEGTLYNNALKGTIPSYKKFGKRYFLKSELLDWIKKGKQKTKRQLAEDVNQKLCEQKRGRRNKEPLCNPNKEKDKSTNFSHFEKIKAASDTAESQGETIEEALNETGQLHFLQNEENINPGEEEE